MGQGVRSGFFSRLFVLTALSLSNGVLAAEQSISSKSIADPKSTPAAKPADKPSGSSAAGLFSRPAVFRGNLGDMQIQFAVRPKAIVDEGHEGEYFIFGRSQKILLAGEVEGENIFLEESENGTNISGQWEGKLQGDLIQGTWKSADESVSKPFKLKLIPGRTTAQKPAPITKATAANSASAPGR